MVHEKYEDFVELSHKPSKKELLCSFYVEPAAGESIKRAAGAVASESSVGTWTSVPGLHLKHVMKIAATCYEINGNWIKIAYPVENFEPGSLPQIFSSIAGNVFGMKAVRNLRLHDVEWPLSIKRSFPGPQFGIDGIRKILKVQGRPITASVPKPKTGMTAEEHAQVGYEIWTGGFDLLKDDENLTSQKFDRFEDRVKHSMRMREKAEKETGERKACLLNITAPFQEMIKRAKLVSDYGNEYVMVDMLTIGWSALQGIREVCEELKLALYAHRAFHAAFTRNRKHGMSMLVVAESARLAGVDNVHIGTVVGKLESPREEVLAIHERMQKQKIESDSRQHLFGEDWGSTKKVISTSSGGLHPGLIPKIIKMLGRDIAIQVGGGVHGHPDGSNAGATAVMQAIDAALKEIPLGKYAKTHKELKAALAQWGYLRPK
ncbi:MAG: type III ribulose-bisphosphate carboxylase [Candidatus Hydrothermarchaeota archaeon]|nr:type III ribulose-bisphosphate carboxylase [Candidatus Hydrothermarchaeota archaeon]